MWVPNNLLLKVIASASCRIRGNSNCLLGRWHTACRGATQFSWAPGKTARDSEECGSQMQQFLLKKNCVNWTPQLQIKGNVPNQLSHSPIWPMKLGSCHHFEYENQTWQLITKSRKKVWSIFPDWLHFEYLKENPTSWLPIVIYRSLHLALKFDQS